MPTSERRRPSEAKYTRLAEKLRAQVHEGWLKPGDQLPSFVELRNEHGVSRGTVEKVHALLERDGLIVREQGRGVFVAEPKRRPKTEVIAFAGGGFAEARISRFWAHLMHGIEEAAGAHGVHLLLVNKGANPRIWESVDGLLLCENEEFAYPILKSLPEGFPCVSLLTPMDEVSSVLFDDVQGARDAVRHLLSLGHRKIGHLVSSHNHLLENRLLGYRQALREYEISPPLSWVRLLKPSARSKNSKAEFFEQGKQTVNAWLGSDWAETGCTAIVAQNDPAAIGAIAALQNAGLRVPEDVSVVGYDGIENYEDFSPSLTTVEVPVQQIGATAVQVLLKSIQHKPIGAEPLALRSRLRIGESTGPAPHSEPIPSH
jgi:DNA-binding LacI/PurR family transcriptional regulator